VSAAILIPMDTNMNTDEIVALRDAVAATLRGCDYQDGSVTAHKVGRKTVTTRTSRPVIVCARGLYIEFTVRSRFRFGGDDYSAQIALHYGGRAIAPRAPRSFANEFEWAMFDRVERVLDAIASDVAAS